MATAPFAPVRPFYWSGGMERTTNGRYAVEVYAFNNGRKLVQMVSIECPDGSSVNGSLYGSDDWPLYDLPHRVPAYVKREARRLLILTR